jgi:hypothetical protein
MAALPQETLPVTDLMGMTLYLAPLRQLEAAAAADY